MRPEKPGPGPRVFIFIIINVLCAFCIREGGMIRSQPESYYVYRIRFEYFGMDAPGMERLVAAPLEERISALGNIAEIRTVCEYALAETTVFFNRESSRGLGGLAATENSQKKKIYLALRDTVDSLYRELPPAVQRPRIYESSGGRRPFFSAAVQVEQGEDLNQVRGYLEHSIRKELENLEGVGEVTVTGGSTTEVHIEFDPGRGAQIGLDPAALGAIVQDANVLSPGGLYYGEDADIPLLIKTRIENLDEIKGLPVKAGEEISTLEYFADIGFAPREQREIFTLNGEECVGISVMAVPGANLTSLSGQCTEILKSAKLPGTTETAGTLDWQILRDEGEVTATMIRGLAGALVQSLIAVMIIIPLFFRELRTILLITLFLPVNVLWSLALLRILGFGADQYLLSGISISLGLVIDPLLVIACKDGRVSSLSKSITASTFTTLLVIVPLCFLEGIVPGIRSTALAIIAMVSSSLILGLVFFPGFLNPSGLPEAGRRSGRKTPLLFRRLRETWIRLGYFSSSCALSRRRISLGLYVSLCLAAFVLFFISGKNLNLEFRLPLLYASVEFENGISNAAVHRNLEAFGRALRNIGGLEFVGLECRNGTGEFEIGFDEGIISREKLAEAISALAPLAGEGFLYVPDAGAGFRSGLYEVEVTAISADANRTRELAKEGAAITEKLGGVVQTVLNFKEPAALIVLRPDREILARSGLSIQELGSSLHWFLYGPVTGKWLRGSWETDIRVMGKDLAKGGRERIGNLVLPSPSGPIRLESAGSLNEEPGSGAIYRRDGRRVSYFTVHIAAGSAGEAAELLRNSLNGERDEGEREAGSGFLLSREFELLNSRYFLVFLVFMGSFAGIFLVLLGMTEKWTSALRISSIIPVSCALPLLVKALGRAPLEMGDAVALVVIAGLSVNNGVFIEESRFSAVRFKIRDKVIPILATSLTGIAGAIPLALLGGEGFSAALSRSILWGITGSLLASLFLFPALYTGPKLRPHDLCLPKL
ncbi:MAG: efflux RND transporter permease subunit [Treponema sp.]|jgi:HAE1 family hydrophobic/amphiphilic exporter-1|nr:efflux RND transporter permease subunit [Treponema sp.]